MYTIRSVVISEKVCGVSGGMTTMSPGPTWRLFPFRIFVPSVPMSVLPVVSLSFAFSSVPPVTRIRDVGGRGRLCGLGSCLVDNNEREQQCKSSLHFPLLRGVGSLPSKLGFDRTYRQSMPQGQQGEVRQYFSGVIAAPAQTSFSRL